jgi:single-stranded DNA-binding protein
MVEGDVSISSYEDADGKPRQGLNITQRRFCHMACSVEGRREKLTCWLGNLEVLRRPYNPAAAAGGEGEQAQ